MSVTTCWSRSGLRHLVRLCKLQHADRDRADRGGRGERRPPALGRARSAARGPPLRPRADRAMRGGEDRRVERARRLFARGRAPRRVERGSRGVGSSVVRSSSQVPELRAQLRHRVAQAALHRLDAGAGELGDLGERQSAFLVQQERVALRGGQRARAPRVSRAPISRAPARVSGSSTRAPGIASTSRASSSPSSSIDTNSPWPARAPVVDEPVVRERVEPRRELRGRRVGRAHADHVHPDVLEQLVGGAGVAAVAQQVAVHAALVPRIERVERARRRRRRRRASGPRRLRRPGRRRRARAGMAREYASAPVRRRATDAVRRCSARQRGGGSGDEARPRRERVRRRARSTGGGSTPIATRFSRRS